MKKLFKKGMLALALIGPMCFAVPQQVDAGRKDDIKIIYKFSNKYVGDDGNVYLEELIIYSINGYEYEVYKTTKYANGCIIEVNY